MTLKRVGAISDFDKIIALNRRRVRKTTPAIGNARDNLLGLHIVAAHGALDPAGVTLAYGTQQTFADKMMARYLHQLAEVLLAMHSKRLTPTETIMTRR